MANRKPPAPPPVSVRKELYEFRDAVSAAFQDLSARIVVIEHALANVIDDVYEPEPSESLNAEDHEPGVAGPEFLMQAEKAAEMARESDFKNDAMIFAEEAAAAEAERRRLREEVLAQAEADWEGDGGA